MFKDAKVGDRVWSMGNGWGEIEDVGEILIGVRFLGEKYKAYNKEGKVWKDDLFPSLFWDEVKIVPPPKPKRKVKKVVEGWINLYPKRRHSFLYPSQREADMGSFLSLRLGPAVFIRHEYEVEE